MTATNMCSNFGGKWDSTPLNGLIFTIFMARIQLVNRQDKRAEHGGGDFTNMNIPPFNLLVTI